MPKLNYCVMKITWANVNVSIEKALTDKITQRVIDSKWTARWYTESMVDAEVVDNIKEMDEVMRRRPSQLELYQWTPTTTTTIGRWSTRQGGGGQEGGGWVWISQRSQGLESMVRPRGPRGLVIIPHMILCHAFRP